MERRNKNRLGLKVAAISLFAVVLWVSVDGAAAAVQPTWPGENITRWA